MKGFGIKLTLFSLLVFTAVLGFAAWMDRYVQTLSADSLQPDRITVIIDAGHGGVDGGASTARGDRESDINLQIALRLESILNLLGYRTVMIRTEDISVYTEGSTIAQKKVSDLKNRVRIINQTDNALLISIHQNSFPDGRYRGSQVFYGNGGSKDLAVKLQKDLISSLDQGGNRKAKAITGVYLMEHVTCPAVLVECGFLSNSAEAALLMDRTYQKKLCCAIAASVSQYLDQSADR